MKPTLEALICYKNRRTRLMEKLDNESLVILASPPVATRTRDIEYPFRQNSDLFYLTGFTEPESILVLAPGRPEGEYILFCRTRDPKAETWTGRRAGQEGVLEYGVQQAFPFQDFEKQLPEILKTRKKIYFPLSHHEGKKLKESVENVVYGDEDAIERGAHEPISLHDCSPMINGMRQIKDEYEITMIKKAIDITANGHMAAMSACKPGMMERQLEAYLMFNFINAGTRDCSYPNIVAGGKNACILHYTENDDELRDGELVLIDAGSELHNYTSDITRTFPVNGKYSPEQKAIYELVLAAQKAGIGAVKPGTTWKTIQTLVIRALTEGLIDLGILKGDLDELIKNEAYSPFFPHGAGHWLGLDAHDVGCYSTPTARSQYPFQAGMVLTMEPGIYISPSDDVEARWHNIGVRIEDNLLVTTTGCEVLSAHIPKEIKEIEEIMASAKEAREGEAIREWLSSRPPVPRPRYPSQDRFFSNQTTQTDEKREAAQKYAEELIPWPRASANH